MSDALNLHVGHDHLVTGWKLEGCVIAGVVGIGGVGDLRNGGASGVNDICEVVDDGVVVNGVSVVDVGGVVFHVGVLCVDERGWSKARCIGEERLKAASARGVSRNEVSCVVSRRKAAVAAGTGELC